MKGLHLQPFFIDNNQAKTRLNEIHLVGQPRQKVIDDYPGETPK
jgi:hypothetical protein